VVFLAHVLAIPAAAESGKRPRLRLVFLDDYNVPTDTPFEQIGSGDERTTGPRQERGGPRSIDDILSSKASGRFGGISAVAYDPSKQQLYALSDTTSPVLFRFRLSLRGGVIELAPDRRIPLTDAGGTPLARWSMDPEGFAFLPQGTLLIASEGFSAGIPYAGVKPTNPALYEIDPGGRLLRAIAVPAKVLGLADSPVGTHENSGLESLTVSPSGKRVYLAAEGSLRQDGPPPDLRNGSRIRIFECAISTGSVASRHEYLYEIQCPPTPSGFRNPRGGRGLTELLALGERELLALERSFVRESGIDQSTRRSEQRVEVYHVDLSSASDVSHAESLRQMEENSCRLAKKTLLLDLRDIIPQLDAEFPSLDNFEGMCLGPRLADGSRTVILVSDNNFNPQQRTVFLAFKLVEI
jgi:hypothetical protein